LEALNHTEFGSTVSAGSTTLLTGFSNLRVAFTISGS
jgi:hypothetical protein